MVLFILVTFIDLFVFVFDVLIVTRVFASYIVGPENRFYNWTVSITEPLLGPVRTWLPNMGGVDLSPLATFFLLQGIQILVHRLTGL